MSKKGFTLIELLITIAIIGILSAIAIPAYIGQQRNAARAEAYSNLQNLRLVEEQFFAEWSCYEPLAGGPPPVCPALPTKNTYTGLAAIKAFLPAFKPGNDTVFNYELRLNRSIVTPVANPPVTQDSGNCFTAVATGKAGTRVADDIFAIDCNNNRNF